MRKRELDAFRTLLEERRHELISEASRTVDGMGENREQFPDPTDRASLEGNRNLVLRIRAHIVRQFADEIAEIGRQ